MTKKNESLRGLYDLYVLLVVYEFGRPAKVSEIKEKTKFPVTSIVLSFMAKRGYVDHDEDAHTWCINDAGRAHLVKIAQRENRGYYSWKEFQH